MAAKLQDLFAWQEGFEPQVSMVVKATSEGDQRLPGIARREPAEAV
jgi:hypothetical protein